MQKNFIVYKSSAGSGKTFTLVKEYLKIALSEAYEQPQLYKKILAVTFTNKAAAEMKERIIDALKNVSQTNNSKPSLITSILSQELQLSADVLAYRAGNLLSQILHNYSDFSIGTIDSFTHKIIKTFAFDLKLPVNFSIETNVSEFYNKVVSSLIAKIGDDKELTELLRTFSINNATDNNSWDPEPQIFKFTNTLEKEDSSVYLEKLKKLSKEELQQIHKTVIDFNTEFKSIIKLAGSKTLALIKQKNLNDEHFNYSKAGPQNVFKKWADFNFDKINELSGSRLLDAVKTGKWQSNKNSAADNEALQEIVPQLSSIAGETLAYINENSKQFALSRLLEKNIYSIILVNELQQIADEFKQEEQIVFISEFNSKISKIVSEEPAPFIYERLGERYSHFLLDEFQDTSTLQWQNILPLIDNSLGNGKFNLIVGDGKQSIYRWRNANVKQFNDLPKIEGANANELISERQNSLERNYKAWPLNTNYRSLGKIVDFNNSVFDFLSGNLLKNDLLKIYEGQAQDKKNESGGYVSVQRGETDKDLLEDTTCTMALQHINRALESGFAYSDICIIIRNNYQGNLTANYLIKNKIPVVSSDSLLLKNCAEVNCVISFLNYLINQADKISAVAVINYLFHSKQIKNDISRDLKDLQKGKSLFDVLKGLSVDFREDHLLQKNIFDICVEIISRLDLHQKNAQYMRFFLDEVNDYLVNKTGSINNFLEWWEKRRDTASVIIPDGTDAVRIMTIHKAKGLEFPVVILPFTNWETYKMQNNWVNLENENTHLPAGLFNISAGIAEAGFGDIFEEEQNEQILDNLNLLYVAFTRAVERLHIITLRSITAKKETVARWIENYLKQSSLKNEGDLFEFGELTAKQFPSRKEHHSVFDISKLYFNDNPNLINIKGTHRLKVADSTEAAKEKGIKMHYILSDINSKNDISPALSKLLKQGIIRAEERQDLELKINELLDNEILRPYFSDKIKSKNESEIITDMGELLRPDKIVLNGDKAVVIDYKTGKQNTKLYQKQMNKYQDALLKMGYISIKKILVYVEENLVEELN